MELPVHKVIDVARLLLSQDRPSVLRELLDGYLNAGFGDWRLLVLSGLEHARSHRPDGATGDFEKALRAMAASDDGLESLRHAIADGSDTDRILAQFEATLEPDPSVNETHHLVASILVEVGDAGAAFEVLERGAEVGNTFVGQLFLATALTNHAHHDLRKLARAEEIFRELYETHPDQPDVCIGLATAISHQSRLSEAEPFYRRHFELRPEVLEYCRKYLDCLVINDKFETVVEVAAAALDHHPDNPLILAYLRDAEQILKAKDRPRMVRWPQSLDELGDIEPAIREHVCNVTVPPGFLFTRDDRIVTLGSCFAENIARSLRGLDVDAFNITIGEEINSTFANLAYVRRVAGDPLDPVSTKIVEVLGRDPIDDRTHFEEATLVVFTLGVAPCFFASASGQFMMFLPREFSIKQLNKEYVWRNTSVEENINNIDAIVDVLTGINPDLKFVFSVSPIPLTCTFNYESVFVADCVSKSTLRVAIDRVVGQRSDQIFYWPSFEAFRWLGAHVGPVFGADDKTANHASGFVVDMVCRVFREKFCVEMT
jgi:tetratricopeptide (TPR) repeat protein